MHKITYACVNHLVLDGVYNCLYLNLQSEEILDWSKL